MYLKTELMKWADILQADTGKLNANFIIFIYTQKLVGRFGSWDSHKCVSHIWFDESSRLIESFLHADSGWVIFGFTTNLPCISDIGWVSTAVVLVKDVVLFLVPTGKVLELVFPKCLCFGYFTPMRHGVNKKAPPIISPHPSP